MMIVTFVASRDIYVVLSRKEKNVVSFWFRSDLSVSSAPSEKRKKKRKD